jgi:hypothetical protein
MAHRYPIRRVTKTITMIKLLVTDHHQLLWRGKSKQRGVKTWLLIFVIYSSKTSIILRTIHLAFPIATLWIRCSIRQETWAQTPKDQEGLSPMTRPWNLKPLITFSRVKLEKRQGLLLLTHLRSSLSLSLIRGLIRTVIMEAFMMNLKCDLALEWRNNQ